MSTPSKDAIARKASTKIHWHHVKKPDAYGQEKAARTTRIIIEAFNELHPALRPMRIL